MATLDVLELVKAKGQRHHVLPRSPIDDDRKDLERLAPSFKSILPITWVPHGSSFSPGRVIFMASNFAPRSVPAFCARTYGVSWAHVGLAQEETVVLDTPYKLYAMFGWGHPAARDGAAEPPGGRPGPARARGARPARQWT